ncbi:hypothetical protein P3S68_017656 [Capsicum galapagoense]
MTFSSVGSSMRGMMEVQRRAKKRWIKFVSTTVACRFVWIERVCHSDGLEMRSSRRTTHQEKTPQRVQQTQGKKDGLLGIVGPSYRVEDIMADLKNKDIPKHYRKKLCLVWFVYSVLLARDVRKAIEHDLLALVDDFRKFNDYPWGYDSYYLTVKYLLKELKLKTTTPYGFPWAFMAWACEVIPPLRKHFKDYPDKVSHPRILRWLKDIKTDVPSVATDESSVATNYLSTATGATNGWVVHPWIVPTIDELGMTFFFTLGLVNTKEDPTVDLLQKELGGATSIRRAVRQGHPNVEALPDQPQAAIDPGASSGGVTGGVVCDGGSQPATASSASRYYEYVGAQQKINIFEITPCIGPPSHPYTGPSYPYSGPSRPSSPICFHCKYKVCKEREDKLLEKLEAIAEATEKLKSRRDVIPYNEVMELCTPTMEVRRKRRKIR